MSAELLDHAGRTPSERPAKAERHLKAVDPRPRRLRIPFLLVLSTLLLAGLGGLVVLNTVIQSQASELTTLRSRSDALGYQQAALSAQVQQLRSGAALEQKAHALGLRPNPTPAFIVLPSGKILGKPTAVTGRELPNQRYLTWEQTQQLQEQARAKVVAERKAAEKAAAERAAAARKAAEEKKKADELAKQQAAEAARKTQAAQAAQKKQSTAQPKPKPTEKKSTGGR